MQKHDGPNYDGTIPNYDASSKRVPNLDLALEARDQKRARLATQDGKAGKLVLSSLPALERLHKLDQAVGITTTGGLIQRVAELEMAIVGVIEQGPLPGRIACLEEQMSPQ